MAKKSSGDERSKNDHIKPITLEIKEEKLDISKERIQTGEVHIYKETLIEDKIFTIPVEHEVLVIEKKELGEASNNYKDSPVEVIRIPLSEEKVEITKHKVDFEEVSVYKQKIKDIKHIEETLKREEVKVEISGDPRVRDISLESESK